MGDDVSALHREPSGQLRIASSLGLGRRFVAPALSELAVRHPQLDIRLDVQDRLVDLFDEGFEQHVEEAVESLVGSMTRSVLWTVFTGHAGQLEKRADKLDADIEQRLEQRGKALEQHAQSLCTQVLALDRVQAALEFRHDGQPLRMMQVSGEAPAPKEQAPDNSIALP